MRRLTLLAATLAAFLGAAVLVSGQQGQSSSGGVDASGVVTANPLQGTTDLRVYNGTPAANLEYGSLTWVSNFFNVGSVTNGGTTRNTRIISSAANVLIAPAGTDAFVYAATGITKFANETTVALGNPDEVASVNLTAQSAALTNTVNYTPPAAVGVYRLTYVYRPTATGASTSVGQTVTFKDSTGSVSLTQIPCKTVNSTALVVPPFANTGATFAECEWTFQIDNSATAITLSTTGTFTGTTYNFQALLEHLQ